MLFVAEMIGIVAFSVAGTMTGLKRRLDIFGAFIMGCVTAVGGGCLRDIFLGSLPPSMFVNPVYAATAAVTSIVVIFIEFVVRKKRIIVSHTYDTIVNVCDAIGLGAFVVVGVDIPVSLGYGDNVFLVLFIATLTGVGGGVLRDVLCAQVPIILHKQVYATIALSGAAIYFVFSKYLMPDYIAGIITVAYAVVMRCLAAHFRWDFPKISK